MGGAAPVDSGRKGRKSLDAELNLVPFIDLLSCLISFLLISAVWTQISSVHVAPTGGLSPVDAHKPPEATVDVRVTMTERGYTLSLGGEDLDLPKVSNADGAGRRYDVRRLVTFEDLTGTIDQIVGAAELPDISVTPE